MAGFLTDGNIFLGTASVRTITPGLKDMMDLSTYWLEEGCKKPHWCNGIPHLHAPGLSESVLHPHEPPQLQ